jgi:hypothetical protein
MTAKEYCDAKNNQITHEVTVRRFDESKLHIGAAYKVFQVYNDPATGYGRKFLFNGILQSVKDHGKEIVLVTSKTSDPTPEQLYRIFEFSIDETPTMMAVTIDIDNIADGHVTIQSYYSSDVVTSSIDTEVDKNYTEDVDYR